MNESWSRLDFPAAVFSEANSGGGITERAGEQTVGFCVQQIKEKIVEDEQIIRGRNS